MIKFGTKLKQLRKHAGVNQRALADYCGVDFTYISKIENNKMPAPSEETIIKMAEVLQVEPDYLILLAGKIPTTLKEDVLKFDYKKFAELRRCVKDMRREE